jgi:peptide chain release factor 1
VEPFQEDSTLIDRDYIEKVLTRVPELETTLSDPATAANQNLFRKLVKEHAALKRIEKKAQRYLSLKERLDENRQLASDETDPELAELAQGEIEELETDLPDAERDLMVALLPENPDEGRNAVMEIRAGTGGDEAALFAGDLFRMYNRHAEAHGWKIGMISASTSEVGGYKEVVFSVEGERAFGGLQYESGVHRVQRVPVTESSGRIHTSASTVAVFPQAEADDDITIAPDEIRIDIYRSSGPGGQSVNTTDSAVRINHLPTGIVVQCQDEKSQHRNKEKAMSVLKTRILDHKRREEAARKGDARRSQIGSGDRSERIRTYNYPQNRVTDHRINLTLYSLDRILEGELQELVNALQNSDTDARLQEELGRAAGKET